MSKTFSITVQDAALKQRLQAALARTQNTQPLLRSMGEGFIQYIDERFKTQTDPSGARWADNKPATVQQYIAARGGFNSLGALNKRGVQLSNSKKVLQGLTNQLRHSVAYDSSNDSLKIVNPVPYAAIHQFGGDFKAWGRTPLTMPARPFVPVRKDGSLYPSATKIINAEITNWAKSLIK